MHMREQVSPWEESNLLLQLPSQVQNPVQDSAHDVPEEARSVVMELELNGQALPLSLTPTWPLPDGPS